MTVVLTTQSAVYFAARPLSNVLEDVRVGRPIFARDDNGTPFWVNPAAIATIREEED